MCSDESIKEKKGKIGKGKKLTLTMVVIAVSDDPTESAGVSMAS